MEWTKEQKKIIDARNCNILVSAAAGSGKTAVLVERIIKMVTDPVHPIDIDRLLVVTFTNAAAAQMREKIGNALEKKQEENPYDAHLVKQLSLIHRANIVTIDSFCLRVVREHFNLLNIDPNARIADEAEIALLKGDVMGQVMEAYYQKGEQAFFDFIDSYSSDKSDEKVEEIIYKLIRVANSYPKPYEWLAKAKEAFRIQDKNELNQAPFMQAAIKDVVLSLKKIKKDMEGALAVCQKPYGPYPLAETIKKDIALIQDVIDCKTYDQFKEGFAVKFSRIAACKDVDVDETLLEQVKSKRDAYKKEMAGLNIFKENIEDVLDDFKQLREPMDVMIDFAVTFLKAFEQEKAQRNIMEFSDIEHMALKVLTDGYDEGGKPIQSAAAKELSLQFEEILIDEYQDSNFLQEDILTSVSRINDGQYNIFMVGDVKQSIYKFRMARPDLFMEKYNTYQEDHETKQKVELKNNFRSRATVLEAINYIFYQIMGDELGGIDYTKDVALVPGRVVEEYKKEDTTELLLVERQGVCHEAEKQEEEDLSKMELEARMVAKRIKTLTGMEGDNPYYVWDGEKKQYRKAELKDIVILFRSMKGWSDVFTKVLLDAGIPVYAESAKGYFDTVEVKTVLSFLGVLDNAHVDIDFVASLRSPMGKITSEELAKIRIHGKKEKKKSFYEQTLDYVKTGEDKALIEKLNGFLNLVGELKEAKKYLSIHQLIWRILEDTGYYTYIGAMPAGQRRQANILMLIEKANDYEATSYKGLFHFMRYIEKLKGYDLDFGEANTLGEHENLVRMMSMHKSKGLEFPIVFASGMGKNYNQMDAKDAIIVHPDYYLGANLVNPNKRTKKNTFMRMAIARNMKLENMAEELRILYVALTRAEEKLIMTGCVADMTKVIGKWKDIAMEQEVRLDYGVLKSAASYLDWIIMALLRHEQFYKAMEQVPERENEKGEMVSCQYTLYMPMKSPQVSFHVELMHMYDFAMESIEGIEATALKIEDVDKLGKEPYNKERYEQIQKRFQWQYENEALTQIKGKLSVTELKGMFRSKEESDILPLGLKKQVVPEFLRDKKGLSSTEKGNILHQFMELLDYHVCVDRPSLEQYLKCCVDRGILTIKERESISLDAVLSFLQCDLGQRMRQAYLENRLFREQQFVIGMPMKEINTESDREDIVILQGIIDAYFIENNEIIILDYKTDRVKPGDEEKLIKRYTTQLHYYAKTLERLLKLPVKQKYIYSFALNSSIEIP